MKVTIHRSRIFNIIILLSKTYFVILQNHSMPVNLTNIFLCRSAGGEFFSPSILTPSVCWTCPDLHSQRPTSLSEDSWTQIWFLPQPSRWLMLQTELTLMLWSNSLEHSGTGNERERGIINRKSKSLRSTNISTTEVYISDSDQIFLSFRA